MPALLWRKATVRGAGSVIYLQIGFGSSAAATARVTAAQPAASPAASPATSPETSPTHGPPEELQVGLLTELQQWLRALLVCGKGSVDTVFQQYIFRCKILNLIFDFFETRSCVIQLKLVLNSRSFFLSFLSTVITGGATKPEILKPKIYWPSVHLI